MVGRWMVLLVAGGLLPGQELVYELLPTPWPDELGVGDAVRTIGDWNGDGYGDFLTRTAICRNYPFQPCAFRGVAVVSGRDGAALVGIPEPSSPFLDYRRYFAIGDMDGDGRRDVAVQVLEFNGPTRMCVMSTQTRLPLWCVSDHFSAQLADFVLGDVDLDGDRQADLVLSRVDPQAFGRPARIEAYDHFGRLLYAVPFGLVGIAGLGKVGDVDGDGCDDFAVGHYGPTSFGHVELLSGRTGAILQSVQGTQRNDNLGHVPTGAGDMDGDGVPDFAAGTISSNLAMVFSSATGSVIHEFRGAPGTGEAGGWALLGGRDLDQDGVPDLVVSAPISANSSNPNWVGSVLAYSGRDGSVLWRRLSDPGHGSLTLYGDTLADLGVWPDSPYPVFALNEPGYVGLRTMGRIQVLRSSLPGAATQVGTGCASQGGVPTIGLRRSTAGLRLNLGGAPAGSFAVLALGTSTTSYLGTPLPLPLDPFGLPGCALLVAPQHLTSRVTGTTGLDRGHAFADFPGVPVAAGGQGWYGQWLVLGGAGAGFAATAAQEFRLR